MYGQYNQEHDRIMKRVSSERSRVPAGGPPSVLSSLLQGGDALHGRGEFEAFAELFPCGGELLEDGALQCMDGRGVLPALGELLSAEGVPFEARLAWVRAAYFAWSAEGEAREALASLLVPDVPALVRGVLVNAVQHHFQKWLKDEETHGPHQLLRLDPCMYGFPELETFPRTVYQFMCTVEARLSPPSCADWEGPAALVAVLREAGTVSPGENTSQVRVFPPGALERPPSQRQEVSFAWHGEREFADETFGFLRGWLSVAQLWRMKVIWEKREEEGEGVGVVRIRM